MATHEYSHSITQVLSVNIFSVYTYMKYYCQTKVSTPSSSLQRNCLNRSFKCKLSSTNFILPHPHIFHILHSDPLLVTFSLTLLIHMLLGLITDLPFMFIPNVLSSFFLSTVFTRPRHCNIFFTNKFF